MGGSAGVSQVQLLQAFVTIGRSVVLLGETVGSEASLFALALVSLVGSAAMRGARRSWTPVHRCKGPALGRSF
jgi:hypothetical protein